MEIPQFTKIHHRSQFIRKVHRAIRRRVLREHRHIVGKIRNPIDPIPVRMVRMPTQQEMAEYW